MDMSELSKMWRAGGGVDRPSQRRKTRANVQRQGSKACAGETRSTRVMRKEEEEEPFTARASNVALLPITAFLGIFLVPPRDKGREAPCNSSCII